MPDIFPIKSSASQISEAIILAGGQGTRLRNYLPDLPKCMAPVSGHPFLFYVINYWRSQGIEKFIFSLGYKHEIIEDYLASHFSTLPYHSVVENEPLGTGGAIMAACYFASGEDMLVTNCDTLFKINLDSFCDYHFTKNAGCTIALKAMSDFDRYGAVELNEDGSVKSFSEKRHYDKGYINGGVYLLKVSSFVSLDLPENFSFEKEYLESPPAGDTIYGQVQDAYFRDIGIPEDYRRANDEMFIPRLDLSDIDKRWTLFLDRDGVINHEKENAYILNKEEFMFYEDVPEAVNILSGKFGKIIIVTNQRGIGKGLMTEEDLSGIHEYMINEILRSGGRIDSIYYCTDTDNKSFYRKPNPGMAFLAARENPGIEFSRSVIAGNKPGDMLFGRHAGMYTVYIASTHPETPFPHPDIDARFDSLFDFAKAINREGFNKKL